MPWVLNPTALRRLRRAQKLDRKEAARRTGLREWTIHRHETPGQAPRTLQAETVKRYKGAYACDAEAFVTWEDHGAAPPRAPAVNDPVAPPLATLSERAQRELAMGAPRSLTLPSGTYELIGPALLKRCMTACALLEGARLAVLGAVEDHDYLPEPAARVLEAPVGAGARFRLAREVAKGLPVYITVFTRAVEHTRRLMDCAERRQSATAIVRVVVKPPEKEWKGFFIFEKRPVPRPFAFLVEEVAG